jgi:hypothetical protein
MNAKPNVQAAKTFGAIAFAKGMQAVPAFDADLLAMLAGREVGDTRTIPEMKAWVSGWHQANAAAQR